MINMFSKTWKTSERKYGVVVDRHTKIRMDGGVEIDADIFRPDAPLEKFPAVLGVHCYPNPLQSAPIMPAGMTPGRGYIEAGDPQFFVRRGYAHVIANVRGTGASGGEYAHYGPQEVQDTAEIIDWIARQPWCDGNVGMFGVSYFAIAQLQVAALNPPNLKCIFAPFGYTDFYRHKFYHGGILAHVFMARGGTFAHADNLRPESWARKKLGDKEYKKAIDKVLQDRDICVVPDLYEALRHPEAGANTLVVDMLLNQFDGEYYLERNPKLENIKMPAYIGACWGMYGLHLPGAFEGWEKIKSFKKMVIGPPIYLDRPLYQPQYEALRWFDCWLKGIDTGVEEESDVRLFIPGTGDWKTAGEWPLPETKWTPFYLHAGGLLSEHEYWPNEGYFTFEDSIYNRGGATFVSPPLVENTEIVGPILLRLYGSTTDNEVFWFVSLLTIDSQGVEKILTRGWLRGSHREIDPARSKPYEVYHPHTTQEFLNPNTVYEFDINLAPTANLFKLGHRIGLRIRCADDEKPDTYLERIATGHLWRQSASRVTIYHNADCPSCLYLPVTRGNIQGTFISGGAIPPEAVIRRYAGEPSARVGMKG